MTKIIDLLDPKNKVDFVQLEREPRRRRRLSTPIPQPPPVRERFKRRALTMADPPLYCYCRMPDDGSLMVRCTKRACPLKWYHVRCIEKNADLRGKWYCRLCRA